MADEEVPKAIFPFLGGRDLASCMFVSKQWRDMAQYDYGSAFVQGDGLRPSVCKRPNPPLATNYKLYQTFYTWKHRRTLLTPRLSFGGLEIFIDICDEDKLIF